MRTWKRGLKQRVKVCSGRLITPFAALVFGAHRVLTHVGVSVFYWRFVSRAIEAGANPFTALGLLASGLLTLDIGGVLDFSETLGAVDGVTVWISCRGTEPSGVV